MEAMEVISKVAKAAKTVTIGLEPVEWAAAAAQQVYDVIAARDAGDVVVLPLAEDAWRIEVTADCRREDDPQGNKLTILVGRGINRKATRKDSAYQYCANLSILCGDNCDWVERDDIRRWAAFYEDASGDRSAQDQQEAAKRYEAKLRENTDHTIVRVGNLVACPHRYMVRTDAIIPWGWTEELDPVAAVDAAYELSVPIKPWEV